MPEVFKKLVGKLVMKATTMDKKKVGSTPRGVAKKEQLLGSIRRDAV